MLRDIAQSYYNKGKTALKWTKTDRSSTDNTAQAATGTRAQQREEVGGAGASRVRELEQGAEEEALADFQIAYQFCPTSPAIDAALTR